MWPGSCSTRGHRVRALVRPTSKVRELDVEVVTGDLRDSESLERAVTGCGLVFHVAADYRLWAKDPGEMYRSNVEGTRNLLTAARQAGVERLFIPAPSAASEFRKDRPGSEDVEVRLEEMTGAYKRSKFQAEQVALEFAATGISGGDRESDGADGRSRFQAHADRQDRGGLSERDDAGIRRYRFESGGCGGYGRGPSAGCERGQPGERYILGCENLTLEQILGRLARISGGKAPRWRIPYAVAYAAGVASTGWANLTGQEPRAPLDAVKMARKKMFVSPDKAKRELGFNPGPVDGALQRAVDWFRANGYV